MTEELFNVWIFIKPEGHEEMHDEVGHSLSAEEAARVFESYIRPERPANVLGIISQVMVTDWGDRCCAHWKRGEGIVWPKPDVEH